MKLSARFSEGLKANNQRYSIRLNRTNIDTPEVMEGFETGNQDKTTLKVCEYWIFKGNHRLI